MMKRLFLLTLFVLFCGCPPIESRFTLENATDQPIYFYDADWLTIEADGTAVEAYSDLCEEAADSTTLRTLAPGDAEIFGWEGGSYYVPSEECREQEADGELIARFCWGTSEVDGVIEEPTCETIRFEFGEDAYQVVE